MSRLARASVVALAVLCLAALPAAASAKSCRSQQITLTRAKGAAWCLPRPPLPRTEADATVQIGRWLGSGQLTPARLQRLVARMPRRQERAFGRSRDAQLKHATTVAQAAGATSSQGPIPPGPGQAGSGYSSEGSVSSTEEDAEHATVHKTHTSKLRREAFGPKCPDFDGNVVTDISMVLSDIRTTERRGRRTTVDTEAKITGTLAGGFTDDFELRGPLKLDLDFAIETRVFTVIAATGKPIGRESTSTRRVKMTASVPASALGGSLETPIQSLEGMTVTGAAGPHGVLTADDLEGDVPLLGSLVGLTWTAKLMGEAGFAATIANATGFECVAATADPASLTLASGQSGTFTVIVRGLDDQRPLPSSSNSRVYSGSLTLSPLGTKLHGPAGGMAFTATSGGGKSVAEVVAVSRRGYAPTLKIPVEERKGLPARFTGTWTTTYTGLYNGWTETIHGTATFVRDPLPSIADEIIAVPYDVESNTIAWEVTGRVTDEHGCTTTYSGSGVDTAAGNRFVNSRLTLQNVGGTYYYSARVYSDHDAGDGPMFTITYSGGAGCNSSHQEPIVDKYLDIGDPHDFGPGTALDTVETSASATRLEGQRTAPGSGFRPRDSSWSFAGSY